MVKDSGARITPADRAEQQAEKICKARVKVDQAIACLLVCAHQTPKVYRSGILVSEWPSTSLTSRVSPATRYSAVP